MTDRVISLIITVAVLAVVGTLVYRANLPAQSTTPQQEDLAADKEVARSTQVKARMIECNRMQDGRILGHGEIRNIGNSDLHYVTVRVHWTNELGLSAETNEIYVLRDEILAPGSTKSFTNVASSASAVKCNVETVDWW